MLYLTESTAKASQGGNKVLLGNGCSSHCVGGQQHQQQPQAPQTSHSVTDSQRAGLLQLRAVTLKLSVQALALVFQEADNVLGLHGISFNHVKWDLM